MDNKNIAFYMRTCLVGGVRTVTEILSSQLTARGFSVSWLIGQHCEFDYLAVPDGVKVTFFPEFDFESEKAKEAYTQFLSQKRIGIVINQCALYDEECAFFNAHTPSDVRLVNVLHNNPIFDHRWLFHKCIRLRRNTLDEHIRRLARTVLFPYIKHKDWMRIRAKFEVLGQAGNPIAVLSPSYIDVLEEIDPRLKKFAVAIPNPIIQKSAVGISKEKIVLYVGRLDNASKRVIDLLKIWKNIENKLPEWKLVVVGTGQDETTLKNAASGSDSIIFTGYQDPKPYYEKAPILAMTSMYEGFPMVLTEAMQHGCVPIAFDSFPAVKDIIENDESGIIIRPFDKKAYADGLLNLVNDEANRMRLAQNAMKSVRRYGADIIADKWIELIKLTLR